MTTGGVSITRRMPAAIERVFAACSRPELLSRWLVCGEYGEASATNELRVGGHFRVEMTRDGEVFGGAEGEYLEIVPPNRLVFTWRAPQLLWLGRRLGGLIQTAFGGAVGAGLPRTGNGYRDP